MNIENIIIGIILPSKLEKIIFDPSDIKNKNIKKSRKGFIFDTISCLYGEIDNVTPANNAPISMEKFNL